MKKTTKSKKTNQKVNSKPQSNVLNDQMISGSEIESLPLGAIATKIIVRKGEIISKTYKVPNCENVIIFPNDISIEAA